jgi:hypothetical protein
MEGSVLWGEPLSAISLSRNAPLVKQTMIWFIKNKKAGPILALPSLSGSRI